MSLQEYFDANKANWDDRVAIHTRSKSYDVEGFLAGNLAILPVDIRELGDVEGKTLLHLQCHFGMDTLSWGRLGATVTGLDFAPKAVAAATELAAKSGVAGARFVEANVYDAVQALSGEQFDVVYTGIGAVCWLPKIGTWAKVVADCMKPGGTFYIREGHPVLYTLDDELTEPGYEMRYSYFEREEPLVLGRRDYLHGQRRRDRNREHAQLRMEPRVGRSGDGADRSGAGDRVRARVRPLRLAGVAVDGAGRRATVETARRRGASRAAHVFDSCAQAGLSAATLFA